MNHKARNVNEMHEDQRRFGDKIADSIASGMGSWRFIIIQTIIVILWIIGNLWIFSHPFDPWPFILLNLVFSTQAAYASPLILMSQNRQSTKDRIAAEEDYRVNRQGEQEIEGVLQRLDKQDEAIFKIVDHTEKLVEMLGETKRP